jgi:flagellar assembly factor FliW
MKLVHQQLGIFDVSEEKIIHFPNGIIGYENLSRFAILSDENWHPFSWLVSLDDNNFCFPIIDPFTLSKKYQSTFPFEIFRSLKPSNSHSDVYCVVTIQGNNGNVTINLKGPILVDYNRKEGKQIILSPEELPVSFPLN